MSIPFIFPTNQSRAIHSVAVSTLTHAWRLSGLLRTIPADDLKNFLLVLSFSDAQGECRPTLQQLAHAMEVSEVKARRRLEHLMQFRWQGQPLVTAVRHGNGLDVYMLVLSDTTITSGSKATAQAASDDASSAGDASSGRAGFEQAAPEDTPSKDAAPGQSMSAQEASALGPRLTHSPAQTTETPQAQRVDQLREQPLTQRVKVIEASRSKYGRPRAEVERVIAEQMGWVQPVSLTPSNLAPSETRQPLGSQEATHSHETGDHETRSNRLNFVRDALKRQLLEIGVDADRVESLLIHFDREQIKRQVAWLPYRDARDPAALLVAAVEHDYEAPLSLRQAPKHQEPIPQNERKAH